MKLRHRSALEEFLRQSSNNRRLFARAKMELNVSGSLESARLRRRKSVKWLAQQTRRTERQINRVLNGGSIDFSVFVDICQALGLEVRIAPRRKS